MPVAKARGRTLANVRPLATSFKFSNPLLPSPSPSALPLVRSQVLHFTLGPFKPWHWWMSWLTDQHQLWLQVRWSHDVPLHASPSSRCVQHIPLRSHTPFALPSLPSLHGSAAPRSRPVGPRRAWVHRGPPDADDSGPVAAQPGPGGNVGVAASRQGLVRGAPALVGLQ